MWLKMYLQGDWGLKALAFLSLDAWVDALRSLGIESALCDRVRTVARP